MAAYELTNLGFKTGVRVLKGGFNEWRKSGRCVRGPWHLRAMAQLRAVSFFVCACCAPTMVGTQRTFCGSKL